MFLEKSVSFGRGIQIKKLSSTEQTDENINKVLRVFTEPLIQLERLSKALSEKQMREPLVNRTSGGAWVGVVQALAECGGRCGLLMRPIKVVQVLLVRPVNPFLN